MIDVSVGPITAPAAFIRRPSPQLAAGLVTHVERSRDVDPALALRQWEGYVAALHAAGYATVEVAPAPDCPDSAFVEDTMIIVDGLAVITAPGAPERAAEVEASREAAVRAGLEVVELADAPVDGVVHLDGGDVLKVGRTIYVGIGGRTTRAGTEALAHHLAAVGRTVVSVPISKTLHLKSQVTALPDGTVVGHRPLVDDPDFWPGFLDVPEPEGAHMISLGEATVLMADGAPRSAELLAARGLEVITVPISEFIKLEGCVTCLSVRVHATD